jgi:hypothetical protein
MRTDGFAATLAALFSELAFGAPASGGYMLNPDDEGLLKSLDKISADAASAVTETGSSVAAHVEHLRYGLSLMNRWSAGENPFEDADWSVSWTRASVTDDGWRTLKTDLRTEADRWLNALRTPRDVQKIELDGMIGSIAHLAYHLGAIRQIDRRLRGPTEGGS